MGEVKNFHIIPGLSGSGKTTMGRALERSVDGASLVVPYTTRKPRPGETEGVDYNFRDFDSFAHQMAQDSEGDWTYSKVGENFYYNSTRATLPSAENPVRILPVSFTELSSVLEDYAPLCRDSIITIVPIVISKRAMTRWFQHSQPLRPTRDLRKEFEAQESLMESCKFDEVFYPTWSIDDDAHRYINIYRSIVNARKGAA